MVGSIAALKFVDRRINISAELLDRVCAPLPQVCVVAEGALTCTEEQPLLKVPEGIGVQLISSLFWALYGHLLRECPTRNLLLLDDLL